MARCGRAGFDTAGKAGRGGARYGPVRWGMAGGARLVLVWKGLARYGRHGSARHGVVGQGRRSEERRG
jgi:hypothetical protein